MTSLALTCTSKLQDPSYLFTAYLWLFQATTEQTTFVALFLYRLKANPKILRPMLRVASIQSLAFKTASMVGTCFVWIKWQRQATASVPHAFDVLFWITSVRRRCGNRTSCGPWATTSRTGTRSRRSRSTSIPRTARLMSKASKSQAKTTPDTRAVLPVAVWRSKPRLILSPRNRAVLYRSLQRSRHCPYNRSHMQSHVFAV